MLKEMSNEMTVIVLVTIIVSLFSPTRHTVSYKSITHKPVSKNHSCMRNSRAYDVRRKGRPTTEVIGMSSHRGLFGFRPRREGWGTTVSVIKQYVVR